MRKMCSRKFLYLQFSLPRWNWEHRPYTRSQHRCACTETGESDIPRGGCIIGYQHLFCKHLLSPGWTTMWPVQWTFTFTHMTSKHVMLGAFFQREDKMSWSLLLLFFLSQNFGCLHSIQVWKLQLQQQRPSVWVGWGGRPWQQQHQQHQPGSVQRLQRTGGDTHPNRLDSSDISISSFYDNMSLIPGDLWDEELWRSISGTHIEVGATQEAYVSLLDSKLWDICKT